MGEESDSKRIEGEIMDLAWTGTDVLFMNKYPKGIKFRFKVKIFVFRIFVHILERFFTERNWVVSEHLGKELKLRHKPMLIEYPRSSPDYQYLVKYPKIKHDGFNILYYFPSGKKNKEFIEWLYGWDIYNSLRLYFNTELLLLNKQYNINWIVVGGKLNMSAIYPYIDFMIRPNRHDGMPMMVRECIINEIPYYWSKETPSIIDVKKLIEINIEAKFDEKTNYAVY